MSDAEKELEARLSQLERHLPTIVRLAQVGEGGFTEEAEAVRQYRERQVEHMARVEGLYEESIQTQKDITARLDRAVLALDLIAARLETARRG